MDIKSLNEKRNKLIADATAIVAGDNISAEQRTQFDAAMADVTAIDGDIARLEAVEQRKATITAQPSRPNPGESADPEERAEVRSARQKESFRNWMRTGQVESRDLSVASTGAVVIPQAFDAAVIEAQKSYGELLNLVNVMKTDDGAPMKLVLDDDTSNGTALVSVGTDASEVDPTLTTKLLQVDTVTVGLVKIDNGLLSDAGFDVEDFIRTKFGIRYFRGVSNSIYNGDTSNVASLAAAFTAGFTSNTTNVLKYVDFATAIGTLDPAYQPNAVWAMSNSALASVIGLSDSNQRPLFLPQYGDASQGFVGTILGKPVKLVTQMPAVATGNAAVLFGDFKAGYTFRQQNPGLAIVALRERYAAAYQTGFAGFARIGGVSTVPNTGNPPVIAITVK
jgi:HK97 family phage major capsid protein